MLSPYFLESPFQKFQSNLSLQLSPSPWDHLTENLADALITLSNNFGALSDQVFETFENLIERFLNYKELKLSSFFSLIGLLTALVNRESHLDLKLVDRVRSLISVDFLDHVEDVISIALENEFEYNYLLSYKSTGLEYNSLLFTSLFQSWLNRIILSLIGVSKENELIDVVLQTVVNSYDDKEMEDTDSDDETLTTIKSKLKANKELIESFVQCSLKQIDELDNGSTYINLSSNERIQLAFHTKSLCYNILAAGCLVDVVDSNSVLNLVKNSLSHSQEIVDAELSPTIIAISSVLCFKEGKHISAQLVYSLPLIISNYSLANIPSSNELIKKISKNFALGLKPLDQDSIITAIYSLINLITVDEDGAPNSAFRELKLQSAKTTFNFDPSSPPHFSRASRANTINSLNLSSSNISLAGSMINTPTNGVNGASSSAERFVFQNVVTAIIEITKIYNDKTITALTVSILSQKFRKVSSYLDLCLLHGLSDIASNLTEKEFLLLTKLFDSSLALGFHNNDNKLITETVIARTHISKALLAEGQNHPLYFIYLNELLSNAVSRGDVQVIEHHRSHGEISEVAKQVSYLFKPIAAILPKDKPLTLENPETISLFRNFWFNLVVHGYNESSELTEKYQQELQTIAFNSPPLASEFPRQHAETSFELNTVLRRGSSNHNVKDQKHIISGISKSNSLEIRTLSYPKLMFLSATSLLEDLRVKTGNCTAILYYFSDPSIIKTNIEKYVGAIAIALIQKYIKFVNISNKNSYFSSDNIANQLTRLLIFCCHRNYDLQDAAFQCANLFLAKLPSSLCHSQSLFTLLDILTLLYDAVIDLSTNKYDAKHEFYLKHSKIKLTLLDSLKWRRSTLENLHRKAKEWCFSTLNKCNQDMKSLLQTYIAELGSYGGRSHTNIEYGVSFAVETAGTILPSDLEINNLVVGTGEKPDTISEFLSQYSWRSRIVTEKASFIPIKDLRREKDAHVNNLRDKIRNGEHVSNDEVLDILDSIASLLVLNQNENSGGLIKDLVSLPFEVFNGSVMKVATTIWLSIIKERNDLSGIFLSELAINWESSIINKQGLFSKDFDLDDEGFLKMTYTPSDKININYQANKVLENLQAHLHLIKLFSSNFQGTLHQHDFYLKTYTNMVLSGLRNLKNSSLHPFARLIRNELIKLGLDVLNVHIKINSGSIVSITNSILDGLLTWFRRRAHYPFGGNELSIKSDLKLLKEIFERVKLLPNFKNYERITSKKNLSLIFLKDEISKISIWLSALNPVEFKTDIIKLDSQLVEFAFNLDPILGINLVDRYPSYEKNIIELIARHPISAIKYQESVKYLLSHSKLFPFLIFVKPISPTDSINLFQSQLFQDPFVIQFNMRSLESHDINLTFFYVPQIVQCLRFDKDGYVGRFVVDTGKADQLFAHQIIWNMLANSYKDEDSQIEDSIKPVLDKVKDEMIRSFSKQDYEFYAAEFKFFNEVTGISGKLKPYIKKTKAEKKMKIDEEMSKVTVPKNVYLPSNPDGVITDINRNSGKPLQSHAKAPFMATFKIHKQVMVAGEQVEVEKWQSAIFKVGDDCRQDVLALQLIAIFKSIWENSGLDLYCFPNRVTATAPGCGVIDVLPNSISRDMLGREAVNGLYEYFISKFGNENSIEYENARNNFVKSLAGYSIISYLLQFKDRHNGNIMYDDQGHILHIDFGFCFDIVPGGVKFEAVPFKLTKEMVKVMGGSNSTESFKMFEELFIEGFLAVRPFAELIIGNVKPMLDSGLPCFKGEKTIKNLRNRFFLNKDDKECIGMLKGLVKKSYESIFTVGYDKFQKMTNGIPY